MSYIGYSRIYCPVIFVNDRFYRKMKGQNCIIFYTKIFSDHIIFWKLKLTINFLNGTLYFFLYYVKYVNYLYYVKLYFFLYMKWCIIQWPSYLDKVRNERNNSDIVHISISCRNVYNSYWKWSPFIRIYFRVLCNTLLMYSTNCIRNIDVQVFIIFHLKSFTLENSITNNIFHSM